jgi:LmbE family N-acetylglucosaminyl deacetylase
VPTDPVPPPTGRPIVFYSPHQDDETLFMGQVIAHHALAGREVHVVLCTNGSTSAVLDALNGVDSNGWWGGWHFPAREGYGPLTRPEFGQARSREFVAAVGQLGVFPQHIHVPAALPDGITVAAATELMISFADLFARQGEPVVGHYTMWWGDPNPDHAHLGQALRDLHGRQPRFADARWLVKPEQAGAAGAAAYQPPPALRPEVLRMTRRSTFPYRSWAPRAGMYAIGYHSVGLAYFDDVERGDVNHIVLP